MEQNLMKSYITDTESFIRKSISEEQLAISVYLDRKNIAQRYAEQFRNSGDEELAKKFDLIAYTLQDILEEEEVHVGQFRQMLYDTLEVSKDKEEEGAEEALQDSEKLETFVDFAKKLNILVD